MARKNGCVCYNAACVFILALILPTSHTTNSEDFHVEYSAAGADLTYRTEVKSLSSSQLLRVRRQAAVASTPTPSPSNVTTADGSNAVTTAASGAQPGGATTPAPIMTTTATPTPSTPTPATTTKATTPAPTTRRPAPATARPNTPAPTTPRPATTTPRPKPPGPSTPRTQITEDDHNYYKSTIAPGTDNSHFVELVDPDSQQSLNAGHRLAVTVNLPFGFRFYGHNVTNVTIATGGFIYMSPFLHQWLTATQYIAPLMANFATTSDADSRIFYKEIGNEFIVEWHNVRLKDQPTGDAFTFQTKLRNDGTITFVYKSLPIPVTNISSAQHPVKIGLSDAFYNDTFIPQYGIKRRTIIEYHRVTFSKEQVEEGTVIILNPLPTCNVISECGTCAQHIGVNFDCKWCDRVQRCSDGLDWLRQDWEKKGCKSSAFAESSQCYNSSAQNTPSNPRTPTGNMPMTPPPHRPHTKPQYPKNTPTSKPKNYDAAANRDDCRNSNGSNCKSESKGTVAAIVAVVLVLVVLLASAGVWVYYAYTHPTSASGMWLMEHRPSQMKAKLGNMKFWKKNTAAGTKYAVESEA